MVISSLGTDTLVHMYTDVQTKVISINEVHGLKIRELTNAFLFVCIMVCDMLKVTMWLLHFHICSCNSP